MLDSYGRSGLAGRAATTYVLVAGQGGTALRPRHFGRRGHGRSLATTATTFVQEGLYRKGLRTVKGIFVCQLNCNLEYTFGIQVTSLQFSASKHPYYCDALVVHGDPDSTPPDPRPVHFSYPYPSPDLWRTETSVSVGSRPVPPWATPVPIVTLAAHLLVNKAYMPLYRLYTPLYKLST